MRGAIYDGPSQAGVLHRDAVFRRSLVVADALAAGLALWIAVLVLGNGDRLMLASVLAAPLAVLVGKIIGLYDRDEVILRRTTLDEAPRLFQLATLYTLLTLLLHRVVMVGTLGDNQLLGLWASFLTFMLGARAVARRIARRITAPERCLVLGDRETTARIASKLADGIGIKVAIVGHAPLTGGHSGVDLEGLQARIVEDDVHRVILAPRLADSDVMLDVIALVKGLGVKVTILPRLFEVVGTSVEFDDIGGMTMLAVRRFGLGHSSRVIKRATDLVGAAGALAAMAPVMAIVAAAIKLDSEGSLLFRQVRVGRDGQRFQIYKFRTMVSDAEDIKHELVGRNETDGIFKIADDPRVTRVGNFLRKTSLDELPQLLNVFRGEMSLVGPRPLVVDEDAKVQGRHRRRLHLTPGMTGPWQILGSTRTPLSEMVKIDYLYVANWSLWNDVKIMIRTVPYMLRRGGL
ncbi:MAG: exopolysaccharide biosynthesis polyprenyl glycosylphosphotransferase [Actinomycetota bacterium]|nr:exopolysaccharide biosynthesis polyprenyl glycosylphosphotransferase [Actinomycetota bacterium]